jgi:chorismate synthase
MLRFLTAGESHGPQLTVIIDGLLAGLPLNGPRDIDPDLRRRQGGYGRGGRQKIERDAAEICGGVRGGRTLGSPITLVVRNRDWDNWRKPMQVEAAGFTAKRVTRVRPGHADLAGALKYGFDDARNVLERASARETAARVAAGTLAKALLAQLDIAVLSHVVQLGPVVTKAEGRPLPEDLEAVDDSPVRCFDGDAEAAMVSEVKAAQADGDSLGGVVEVLAYGVPVGLGSHVHWDRKLDGMLAQALMSIQAVKAVELGEGIEVASRRGSEAHDEIVWDADDRGYRRGSARAGGIEGGISNGELLVARVAMKPLSTLNKPVLRTVDVRTKEETVSFKERTDVTAVPAMGVVAETMTALVLAGEAQRKFGGDSLDELLRNRDGYLSSLR